MAEGCSGQTISLLFDNCCQAAAAAAAVAEDDVSCSGVNSVDIQHSLSDTADSGQAKTHRPLGRLVFDNNDANDEAARQYQHHCHRHQHL